LVSGLPDDNVPSYKVAASGPSRQVGHKGCWTQGKGNRVEPIFVSKSSGRKIVANDAQKKRTWRLKAQNSHWGGGKPIRDDWEAD